MAATLLLATPPCAVEAAEGAASVVLDPVVVTATRQAQRSFDLPIAVDAIDADVLQFGRPMIDLTESLQRVPGLLARNRQNYAQDLQISSRGFGARSTFGVRGIRLFQDDIPATMPDGQGQTGSFQLLTARRVEVVRGPFSTLYGNASGGVISVLSESGGDEPVVSFSGGGGSFGTWTAGVKASGPAGGARYVGAATHFSTDGYREHSSARRTLALAKLDFALPAGTRVMLLGTHQDQPDAQDPLGLTEAQWRDDPRQAPAVALLFDTRKSVRQTQGGVRLEHALGAATDLRVTGYGGRRDVLQFLAFSGAAPASSGGVVDLDRDYGGASVKLFHRLDVGGVPVRLAAGVDYDLQDERRRGFVNENGQPGALRRDEDDRVDSRDVYAQAEWRLLPQVSAIAGVRTSEVRFRIRDAFVTAANPDDSGAVSFRDMTPVLGATWHVADAVNLYASYGEGFETPTFTELAYPSDGTGPNLTLDASTSRAVEAGVKALLGSGHRLNAAVFAVDTDDEIVVDSAVGGRTTYRNAGATRRRGMEVLWDGQVGEEVRVHVAYTWLRAEFADAFVSRGERVEAGARLPGVAEHAGYAEVVWQPARLPGWSLAADVQHVGRVAVNDRNDAFAPAYTIAGVRAGYERALGRSTLRTFVRVDNLFDRDYVGSVIVGDANGRFYEPAPGRNVFVGVAADVRL